MKTYFVFLKNKLLFLLFPLFLFGCGEKKEQQNAANIILYGILFLFFITIAPRILEWLRKNLIKSIGVNDLKFLSDLSFYICWIGGTIFAIFYSMPSHLRPLWVLWSLIASGYVFYQYHVKLSPNIAIDEKKEARKEALGKIRSALTLTIVFWIIFTKFKILMKLI